MSWSPEDDDDDNDDDKDVQNLKLRAQQVRRLCRVPSARHTPRCSALPIPDEQLANSPAAFALEAR